MEKLCESERGRETEGERGTGSEPAQYDPDRLDCRSYPAIPLVHGNMCRTCVHVPLRSLHNQENTERKAARPALTSSSSSPRANGPESGFSMGLLGEPGSVGSISVGSI